ncbi:MAG: penicillin acylase family protein, partial [Spirochaetia bacterium]
IFNLGPFPCGGDATTVNQTAVDLNNVTGNPLVTVSLRMVLDIGNWDENSFSLPGGQSGNPFSPHYADLLNFWRQGRGISLAWSEEETVSRTRSTLELVPGGRN